MHRYESRILRLEQSLTSIDLATSDAGQLERALQADSAGTATLAQYRAVHGEKAREYYFAAVPALVALRRADIKAFFTDIPLNACAYPPDQSLPRHFVEHIADCWSAAVRPLSKAELRRAGPDDRRNPVVRRRSAAIEFELYGDPEARSWRETLWLRDNVDGTWRLRPAVLEASEAPFEHTECPGPQPDELYSTLAVALHEAGGHVEIWGPATVRYSDLVDAAINIASSSDGIPPAWSKEVKNGHS